VLLLAALALLWRWVAPSAAAPPGASGYVAYSKGYRDGLAGREFEPIADVASGGSSSGGGGFGIGSLFNLLLVGSMLKQWAGTPPSLQNLLANARGANPMQLMLLFRIVSSLFFR
jgi:tetrahydromethanopterin S-methyltransferase subunit F